MTYNVFGGTLNPAQSVSQLGLNAFSLDVLVLTHNWKMCSRIDMQTHAGPIPCTVSLRLSEC